MKRDFGNAIFQSAPAINGGGGKRKQQRTRAFVKAIFWQG